MASFQPADTLRSRTFIGLLFAQFLAAFNDQAIHASAMFFAINQGTLTEAQAISLMPILFYVRQFPEGGEAVAAARNLAAYYDCHSARASFRNTVPPPPPPRQAQTS